MPSDGTDPSTPKALLEHVRFLRGLARSLVSHTEADDVVQATLLRAIERPPRPDNFRGWLATVARNLARRLQRDERRRTRRQQRSARPEQVPPPQDIVARLEVQNHVLQAVRALPGHYRDVIVLRYFDDLSRPEIARHLGVPLETVRTRLRRALALLRQKLDESAGDRQSWCLALLPLLKSQALVTGPPSHATVTGESRFVSTGLALGLKTAAVLLAVGGVGAIAWMSHGVSGSPSQHTQPADHALEVPVPVAEAEEQPVARDTDYVLRGVVRDPEGHALSGTDLIARKGQVNDDAGQVTSDRDGRFVLTVRDCGWVPITARKEGYVSWRGALDPLREEEHEVILRRGAPLSVRVVSSARVPVAGVHVRASSCEARGVAGMWQSAQVTGLGAGVSDEAGHVELGAAPEGQIEISTEDPRFPPTRLRCYVTGIDPREYEVILTLGGKLRGKVYDPRGAVVKGARVYSARSPDHVAVSETDGSFLLAAVPEGQTRVFAEARGFGVGYFGTKQGWGEPIPIRVLAGHTVVGVDIVVAPALYVSGRVLDDRGRGVEGVEVQGFVEPQLPIRAGRFHTGGDGRFEAGPFRHSAGRHVRLSFEKTGFTIVPVRRKLPRRAGVLDLGNLPARRNATVRGRALDANGEPLLRGRLRILPGKATIPVARDGAFAVENTVPGVLWLCAEATNPYRRSRAVAVAVQPGASVEGLELKILVTASIHGRVLTPSGAPRSRVSVGARPLDGDWPDGRLCAHALTDEEGRFVLQHLPDGEYQVGVVQPPQLRARPLDVLPFVPGPVAVHMLRPSADAPAHAIEAAFSPHPALIRARAGARALTLVLPIRGAIVKGHVASCETARPVNTCNVSFIRYRGLVPTDSEALHVSNARGAFLHELADGGSWTVEVTAPGHATYRSPILRFDPGSTTDLGTIRLQKGGTLVGTVTDSAGQPVPYARIYALGSLLQRHKEKLFTGIDGGYRSGPLAAGVYTVFIVSPKHPLAIVREVIIKDKETSRASARLELPSSVTLAVLDETGRGIPGAKVSYTVPALVPFDSRLLSAYEPPAWGGHVTDEAGLLTKPCVPAARIITRIVADGFAPATRTFDLTSTREAKYEVRLKRAR